MSIEQTTAASNDPEAIRAQIERTREHLSDDVNALAYEVNPKNVMRRKTQRVSGAAADLRDRVMGSASDAKDAAGNAALAIGDAASSAPAQVTNRTQGSPMAAGLIAFGAGLVVASLIAPTRTERRVAAEVKDKAEPFVDEAKQIVKETAQELKEPAQDAAESVKARAAQAATTVKQEGQSAAVDVRDEAQAHARETVQDNRMA